MLDWILSQSCRNALPLYTVNQLAREAKTQTYSTSSLLPTLTLLLINWKNLKFRFGCDFALFKQFSTKQLCDILTIICIASGKPQDKCCFFSLISQWLPILHVKCDVGSRRENVLQPKLLLQFGDYSYLFKLFSYVRNYSLFKNLFNEKLLSYEHQSSDCTFKISWLVSKQYKSPI